MSALSVLNNKFEWVRNNDEETKLKTAAVILLYGSHVLENMEGRKALRKLGMPNKDVMQMREVALSLNELTRLKYPLFDAVLHGKNDLISLKKFCINNKVDPHDAHILKEILRKPSGVRVAETLKKYKITSIPHPDTIDYECNRYILCQEVLDWTNRFVYRKLRAFYGAEKMSQEDYVNDLLFCAIRAYKYTRPLYDRVHAYNYAKRTIHHTGIRKITYWKANKRALLVNTSDGYGNLNRDIMMQDEEGREALSFEVERAVGQIDSGERSEFFLSLLQAQQLFKGKKLIALKLLCLENNEIFVSWYNKQFGTQLKHVKDVFFRCDSHNEYIEIISSYFGTNFARMEKLIEEFIFVLKGK